MVAAIKLSSLALAALLGCTSAAAVARDTLQPLRVADGVYAFIGDGTEASAANRGFAGNSGFVVGTTGVTVVDSGASRRHGQRMLEAISRVTRLPVVLVINTHAVQEFVFGNGAFRDAGIPVLAHKETADLMRARCGHCLDRLRPVLGDELAETALVLPDREIAVSMTIDSGGRALELLYFGWAATPGDLAVLDRGSGTLFAGGLAASGRVPEIRDCDFPGWQAALERLAKMPIRTVVPGFGHPGGTETLAATAGYLRALDALVGKLYARGTSLLETLDQGELPAYRGWKLYDELQRRNAQHRYLQLEIGDLGGNPRSVAMPGQ